MLTSNMVADVIKLFNGCQKNENHNFNKNHLITFIAKLSDRELADALGKKVNNRLRQMLSDNFSKCNGNCRLFVLYLMMAYYTTFNDCILFRFGRSKHWRYP